MNPKHRPDIKTILKHPYFTYSPEASPKVLNPFTSPLGTPERAGIFNGQKVFEESNFGSEQVPSFGSSMNDWLHDSLMEWSPVTKNKSSYEEQKKSKNLLNSGDGLPTQKAKRSKYSADKASYYKKSRSHVVEDTSDSNFSGFGGNYFAELKAQSKRKNSNQMQIDDEITNISNNQDLFGKQDNDDLPAFGHLLASDQKEDLNRRKSQHVGQASSFADLTTFGISNDNEQPKSITSRYLKQDSFNVFNNAPSFPWFGAVDQHDELMDVINPSENKNKPQMKQSIWDDDELMFAVAQNDNQ